MRPTEYEIVIHGRLEDRLVEALDGFRVTGTGASDTTVRGCVDDQEALHRVLGRISDLGLQLMGLRRIGPADG
jgi:hypothetical protein